MPPLYEHIKALEVWRRRAPRRLLNRFRYPTDLAKLLAIDAPRSDEELIALYELARQVTSGHIVEIGTFRGSSTVALALGARGAAGRPRVYAIDPYEPYTGELGRAFGPQDRATLLKNLLRAGVAEEVWMIHLPSDAAARAWEATIGLLWIDGDHSYEGARRDLETWSKFVLPTGLIALDDSIDPNVGPYRVVQEAQSSGRFERVDVRGKITVLRRKTLTPEPVA